MALTNKLSAIGEAIRGKTGKTNLLTLDEMPTEINSISVGSAAVINSLEITSNGTYNAPDGVDGYSPITVNVPQDGAPTAEELHLTGNFNYRFHRDGWTWFINKYGNQITTANIEGAGSTFSECTTLEYIPFELNFTTSSNVDIGSMFEQCSKLKSVPKLNNCKVNKLSSIFNGCSSIRDFPEDFESYFDWTYMENLSSQYNGYVSAMFSGCKSARKIPVEILKHFNPYIRYGYAAYNSLCNGCACLDELVNVPIPYTKTAWTGNAFSGFVSNCYRLKNLTFALQEDGTPYKVQWKSQTISLNAYIGYASGEYDITAYSATSGVTSDKCIKDEATYQALKNDPDSFTVGPTYSRYNHDSAVATINTLPDTSEYLATAGGTNTIQFVGSAGSGTDGGAINTLTEEEIAVATAKGWTVAIN